MDNPREDGGPSDQELLGGTERILFIDDEPAVVELYKNLLEKYGYSVVIRTSSIEAVELFRNNPDRFDVVVTDQTMPSITGYELAQEILLIRPGIPIILCTGYSATISPEIAKSIGIREYVMKPVITRELTRIIRKIFDQPHEE